MKIKPSKCSGNVGGNVLPQEMKSASPSFKGQELKELLLPVAISRSECLCGGNLGGSQYSSSSEVEDTLVGEFHSLFRDAGINSSQLSACAVWVNLLSFFSCLNKESSTEYVSPIQLKFLFLFFSIFSLLSLFCSYSHLFLCFHGEISAEEPESWGSYSQSQQLFSKIWHN